MNLLTSLEALEALLAQSHRGPILLFKHSETCGLSLQAHEEVSALVADAAFGVPVHLVSVQRSRPVSEAIAARLGVRHQSPQMLLVLDGAVAWHTSHLAITADAVRAAVSRLPVATR
ncbi:general stress protein [Luteitalea sp. TBR-22]|uniref:bacillithiol system redox-active protein YtxJ n=1 Tax=Luteitalea sp. TBR-22 TaxID=2802971 RepID=UPI001AF0EBA3|nr:bacillithiol system redox-active protein YtxJ [Luteitalea sp. TBR-22]BCS32497.1 general stress protein [Luteitalea sp. TBR-22]